MKVVVDTNVLVSGLLNPYRTPAQIVGLILSGRLTVLYDNRVLSEYREVLSREKFAFAPQNVAALLDYLAAAGEYVVAEPQGMELEDPDDSVFYDVAITGEADYLITGNAKHFPATSKVTSSRDFIRRYRRSG